MCKDGIKVRLGFVKFLRNSGKLEPLVDNMKVKFFNRELWSSYANVISILSMLAGTYLYFWEIPENIKSCVGIIFLIVIFGIFIVKFYNANQLKNIVLEIDGSIVEIRQGDVFEEIDNSLVTISFNEYFDTSVDNVLIAEKTINGQFLKTKVRDVGKFEKFLNDSLINVNCSINETKELGKNKKYELGTTIVYEDKYLITAFAKFDKNNRAVLTIDEYISFLMNFWKKVDQLYALRTIVIPIFGSGITRIEENNPISDEDLLRIILWTFKLSSMKFNHSESKLIITIHSNNMKNINLFNIQGIKNGL